MRSKERIAERRTCDGSSDNRIVNIILIGEIDGVLSLLIHLISIADVSRWLLLLDQSLPITLWVVAMIIIIIRMQMPQRCWVLVSGLPSVVSSFIWYNERLPLTLNKLILPWAKIGLSIWGLFGVEEPIWLYHSGILLLWGSSFKSTSIIALMSLLIVRWNYSIWDLIVFHIVSWVFHVSIARSPSSHRPYVPFKVVPYSLRCCLVAIRLHPLAALIGGGLVSILSAIVHSDILLLVLNISPIRLPLLKILFSDSLTLLISRCNRAIGLLLLLLRLLIRSSFDSCFEYLFRRSYIWMVLLVSILRIISFMMAYEMLWRLFSWWIDSLLKHLFWLLLVPMVISICFINRWCPFVLLLNHIRDSISHRGCFWSIYLYWWSSIGREKTSSIE